jgi:hypothetical protein
MKLLMEVKRRSDTLWLVWLKMYLMWVIWCRTWMDNLMHASRHSLHWVSSPHSFKIYMQTVAPHHVSWSQKACSSSDIFNVQHWHFFLPISNHSKIQLVGFILCTQFYSPMNFLSLFSLQFPSIIPRR